MRAGWKWNVWVEGDAQWENRFTKSAQYEDPFPATIDGAASAMPPGVSWERFNDKWEACGTAIVFEVSCYDTGDEIHDRYLLAKLAWEAMGPTK